MLIQKNKYEKDDIISLKLSNGDEIVGKLVSESDVQYVLYRPLIVVPSQQGLGLMQSMFSAEPANQFEIPKTHVMMHCATMNSMATHYQELTSGIQLVKKGSILS
jgi:hypothetical protein